MIQGKKLPLLVLMLCLVTGLAKAQTFDQPSEGKSLVYFVRYSALGAAINFKFFDGEKYLGKQNGIYYFKYECEPGEHIFWVASENRNFLKANLQPNATYVVEATPTFGAIKAGARLTPVSPNNERIVKKVKKLLKKKPEPTTLKGLEDDMAFMIENGMKKYEKVKDQVPVLNSNWIFK